MRLLFIDNDVFKDVQSVGSVQRGSSMWVMGVRAKGFIAGGWHRGSAQTKRSPLLNVRVLDGGSLCSMPILRNDNVPSRQCPHVQCRPVIPSCCMPILRNPPCHMALDP